MPRILCVIYWSNRAVGALGSTPPLSQSSCVHTWLLWGKSNNSCLTWSTFVQPRDLWIKGCHCRKKSEKFQSIDSLVQDKTTSMETEQLCSNLCFAYLAKSQAKTCPGRKNSGFQVYNMNLVSYPPVLGDFCNDGTLNRLHPCWTDVLLESCIVSIIAKSQIHSLCQVEARNFISLLRPAIKDKKKRSPKESTADFRSQIILLLHHNNETTNCKLKPGYIVSRGKCFFFAFFFYNIGLKDKIHHLCATNYYNSLFSMYFKDLPYVASHRIFHTPCIVRNLFYIQCKVASNPRLKRWSSGGFAVICWKTIKGKVMWTWGQEA